MSTEPEVMQLADGFAELTLETRDLDGLAAFYERALGLRVLAREDDRIWLSCGPRARLGLWWPGEKEFGDEGGRHVHFAVSIVSAHLDALADRLRSLGVACEGPVEHDGGDRSLYFEDPEGNVVEAWDFFARGETVAELQDG
jgi:catechol-2,3-dioxygenase